MTHFITLAPAHEKWLLLILAGIQFTHILDFMILMPLAPMLMRAFNLTTGKFGLLVSSYTFAAAASAIQAATLIDHFDRRQVVLIVFAAFIMAILLAGRVMPASS